MKITYFSGLLASLLSNFVLAAPLDPPKDVTLPFQNEQINHSGWSNSHLGLLFEYDLTLNKKVVCTFRGLQRGGFFFSDGKKIIQTPNNFTGRKMTFTNKGATNQSQYHVDSKNRIGLFDPRNEKSYASCHYEADN
ncbi:MAG: hypothetical protein H0W64_07525 [Gammaproteobacteria bacterium]|nr:hypothetical protein [Gammaproteobacteria bacterium]